MGNKIGHVTYTYLNRPGCRVTLEVSALSDSYRCHIHINGAPTRAARRRTLAGSLRWGLDTAEWQVELLGFEPPRPTLELVYDEVEATLAA